MRRWITIAGVVMATAAGLFLSSCGADQKSDAPRRGEVQETSTPIEYPFDWCLVSEEDITCMGEPIAHNYKGQIVKFCCDQCFKAFKNDPRYYLKKLELGTMVPPAIRSNHA